MTDDYIESLGSAFLSHRLRRSSDRIIDQIGPALEQEGLSVPPRGASMLLLIDERGPVGVVEISRLLRLSHPLIVRMAQRFEALGLVTTANDPDDARRKLLRPTPKARAEAIKIRAFNARVAAMVDALSSEIGVDLIAALDRFDRALEASPIDQRLSPARASKDKADAA